MVLRSIGVIPDGNRRYAKKKGISYAESYHRGFDKAKEVFEWCIEHPSINKAVVYALSTENVERNDEELEVLYELYHSNLGKLVEDSMIHDNRVKVDLIGREEHLKVLQDPIEKLKSATGDYGDYEIKIALGYGGRKEIVDAARRAIEAGEGLSEDSISKYLYSEFDLDLVIRTGGFHRLSNFQLWQAAYAELYFTDKLWPEFNRGEFNRSVEFYEETKRKFGR